MRTLVTALCLLTLAFGSPRARAATQTPAEIALGKAQVENINQKTVYFVDELNALDVKRVINDVYDWRRPDSDNVTFDLATRTVWVKVRLSNPGREAVLAHIELNPVFLERITAYDADGRLLDATGSKVAPHRIEAFPTLGLSVPPGAHDYYISTRSRANSISMTLRSPDTQATKDAFDLAMASALIGGLLTLIFYHLFMFVTHRSRNYAFYSLFIASTALFTLTFTSYHRQLLPASIFGFGADFWWSAIAAEIMPFFMYIFSADLLGFLPRKSTQRRRLALGLVALPVFHVLCLTLMVVTDHPSVLIPVRLGGVLHILVLPAVAVYLWRRDRTNTIALYYAISWVPFAGGATMVGLWLSGAVGHSDIYPWSIPIGVLAQSLLLSFAASQRLKKRDSVITAFVSSEIVKELDQGQDPLSYSPRNVEKCIVFLDMHDYTKFSEAHSPMECHQILNQYFHVINATTYANGGRVDKIIGDAMMIIFDDPKACLGAIVQLRRDLSVLNRKRVAEDKMPIRFGVGVSYGAMLSANFGSNQKLDRTMVGDTVNVASRLEAITRTLAVDVLCSQEFVEQHPSYQYFRPAGYVLLKGRQKKSLVYEMFEHNLPEVVAWKVGTRQVLPTVIDLELTGHYDAALAELRGLIARCPEHSYKAGQIMDPTLHSMVNAIEEKMRQLGLPPLRKVV